MALLTAKDIHVTVGDRHLLRGVSLVVGEGERLGLVGANGCGKSTLLRVLAGDLVPDRGERTLRRELQLAFLPQEPQLEPVASIRDVVQQGLAGRQEVELQLAHVHEALARPDLSPEEMERLLQKQQRLDEHLHELGGHDVAHRVEAMLGHLGLPRPDARCGALSGGERRRTALARMLLAEPELLLLDEPTNHLDAEVTAWLEGFLRDQGTPLVVVTHDRYLLDRIVDRIVEIEDGVLHSYDGAYREFIAQRAERLEREAKTESSRRNLLRREAEWMKRGPPARTTKAKARIGRFEALVEGAPPPEAAELEFRIPDGPRLGDRVVRIRGASKSYGAHTVLNPFDLEILGGDRIGVVGPNGVGKTTLLKLCTGELAADAGEVAIGSTVKYAAIDQQRTALDPDKTVLQEITGGNDYVFVGGRNMRVETFLDQFLFPGPRKHALVSTLSGGEKNRVLLAKLLSAGGNVLVLDEPTNDLDLMTLRALEEALLAFAGAVLVVSHDRWFLDRIATRVVHLDGSGRVRVHEGDLSLLLDRLQAEAAATATATAGKPAARAPERSPAPKLRKLSSREQKELAELPARIEAAEAELRQVDERLGDPLLYGAAGRAEFDRLTARRKALPGEIASLYARWEELETIAEQARG